MRLNGQWEARPRETGTVRVKGWWSWEGRGVSNGRGGSLVVWGWGLSNLREGWVVQVRLSGRYGENWGSLGKLRWTTNAKRI